MKTATQLKAHIRNLSKKTNIEAEVLLRNFMFERILERISLSEYKHSFILKGGMLISAIFGIEARTTMDMDATLIGIPLTITHLKTIFESILLVPVDDVISFSFREVEVIREEAEYPGFRVTVISSFERTQQTLKIDITTGDTITPREIEFDYKPMFSEKPIKIMSYNIETVLAEKFETLFSRSIANTRMRDSYDIYIINNTHNYDKATFETALSNTIKARKTSTHIKDYGHIIAVIEESSIMLDLWERYRKNYSYATVITWEMVIDAVKAVVRTL